MKIFLYLIFCIIIFIVYVRIVENRTLFIPSRTILSNPSDIGLPYEDVYFKTKDNIKLNGWLIKKFGEADNKKSTLIFFHGNAGNIGDRLEKINIFYRMGLNVFIVDYRGYGNSEGFPTEEGMYKDAMAAYDYIVKREDINSDKIIIYGASLGGAAAVDLASKRKSACLIVDSSFSSAKDMAKVVLPFIPTFIVKTKLDSINKIKKIDTPKLFIHSLTDETVPYSLGKKLYDNAPEPKKFLHIEGGHNDFRAGDDNYISSVSEFLKNLDFI